MFSVRVLLCSPSLVPSSTMVLSWCRPVCLGFTMVKPGIILVHPTCHMCKPGRHRGKPGYTMAKLLKPVCPCGILVHPGSPGEALVCAGIALCCPCYPRFAPDRLGLSGSSPMPSRFVTVSLRFLTSLQFPWVYPGCIKHFYTTMKAPRFILVLPSLPR